MLAGLKPLRPVRRKDAFDDPDWIFELKHDGFRALAYVDGPSCRLVSRNRHPFIEFESLGIAVAASLGAESAVLDGEIVCLDAQGRSRFYDLLARQSDPYLCVFDLLWVDGEDLRELPLLSRKERLRSLVPGTSSRLLYVDHIEGQGTALFEKVCALDLEGVIAKRKKGLYREGTTWFKIKNPSYSQAEGRGDLFDRRRGG